MNLSKSKSIMVVAGEVSGDMHAARVITELFSKNKKIKLFGMGGPQMAKAGMDVREDLTRQALIGFWEILKHYPMIKRRFDQCVSWLKQEKPDLLLLVDYPGFNLRLAEKAYQFGVPVCYYVAPQVWAWHESRIPAMKKVIRKLLVILPFEKKFFKKKGMKAEYVGHPLIEEMGLRPAARNQVLKKYGKESSAFPLICAMPGSRKEEIEKMWPLFREAARLIQKSYPDAVFAVPKPAGLSYDDYGGISPEDPFFFVEAPAYDLRKLCDVAWVKSGTGTLETALLKTPLVVVYKAAALTGFLAKRLLKIKNVSLINLLAGRRVVTELLQEKATPEALVEETNRLLDNKTIRNQQLQAFEKIKKSISKPPRASRNAAREILKLLAVTK
jgi:lipid-A-disaccharide synthase